MGNGAGSNGIRKNWVLVKIKDGAFIETINRVLFHVRKTAQMKLPFDVVRMVGLDIRRFVGFVVISFDRNTLIGHIFKLLTYETFF